MQSMTNVRSRRWTPLPASVEGGRVEAAVGASAPVATSMGMPSTGAGMGVDGRELLLPMVRRERERSGECAHHSELCLQVLGLCHASSHLGVNVNAAVDFFLSLDSRKFYIYATAPRYSSEYATPNAGKKRMRQSRSSWSSLVGE